MRRQTMPVEFTCDRCGRNWYSPPGTGCETCPGAKSTPDPVVWNVGLVRGTNILISAHLRSWERFQRLILDGVTTMIDVAGDPTQEYVWRPSDSDIRQNFLQYELIENVVDDNIALPAHAFDRVHQILSESADNGYYTLLFCAAGLKRSPHLLYGHLRRLGHDSSEAWRLVQEARPMASIWPPYIESAEKWVAGSELSSSPQSGITTS